MTTINPKFVLLVCEELFGCHVTRVGPTIEIDHMFECACCHIPIDIKAWVHAKHEDDCVINPVRDYLAKYKPECVRSHGIDWQKPPSGDWG